MLLIREQEIILPGHEAIQNLHLYFSIILIHKPVKNTQKKFAQAVLKNWNK